MRAFLAGLVATAILVVAGIVVLDLAQISEVAATATTATRVR